MEAGGSQLVSQGHLVIRRLACLTKLTKGNAADSPTRAPFLQSASVKDGFLMSVRGEGNGRISRRAHSCWMCFFFFPPVLSGNSSDNKQISSLANDHVKVECKSAAAVNEDGRRFCSALEATAGRYSCQNELLFYSQINGVWLQPSESRLSPKSRSVGWLSDADNGTGPISRPHSSHSFNFMSCVTFSNYCNLLLYSCCRAARHLLLQVSPVWSCSTVWEEMVKFSLTFMSEEWFGHLTKLHSPFPFFLHF